MGVAQFLEHALRLGPVLTVIVETERHVVGDHDERCVGERTLGPDGLGLVHCHAGHGR